MNANELTALISECLREIDDHEFFLKLESVLRQQQAEIEALKMEIHSLTYGERLTEYLRKAQKK
jgi:cell division protein FtsL